ncbi:hypothetical protein FRC07_005417, partial [Ceratobasidium sp. 392]
MSSDEPNQKKARNRLKQLGDGFTAAFHSTSAHPSYASANQSSEPASGPGPTDSETTGPEPSGSGTSSTVDIASADTGNKAPAEPLADTRPSSNLTHTSVHSAGSHHRTTNTALAGLKGSLKALRQCTNLVPPLKPVVDVLIDGIDIAPAIRSFPQTQETTRRRREYEQLASNITFVVQGLEKQLSQLGPGSMSESVASVVEELKKQAEYANERQQRRRSDRYVNADQDVDDIIECYRRIEALFRLLHNDAMLNVWKITNKNLAIANEHLIRSHLNDLNPAKQAHYNSSAAAQVRRRGCTANTRELVLAELRNWASNPDSAKIYWMNGMAGTGKTTIAYSLCANLKSANQLAASFFCSRALPDCQDVTRIVPTIAYQLARFSRTFQVSLCQVLEDEPDISTCDIATQFEKLLTGPLTEVKDTMLAGLFVVVVDALDECMDRAEAQTLLNTLLRHIAVLPIKFFVTCRPEPYLLDKVASQGNLSSSIFHLHNIEESLVQADIETYLTTELEPINVSTADIKRLSKLADKLFIYAATAMRYVRLDITLVDHRKRLDTILNAKTSSNSKAHETIDALYATIISSAVDNEELEDSEVETIKLVLYTVVCAREPMTMIALAGLLKLENLNIVHISLQSLQSVLHVSNETGLVSTFHASFPDYMLSRRRSGHLYCDPERHNKLLAHRCFSLMAAELPRFNIRDLQQPSGPQDETLELAIRLDKAVSSHLFYACQYWGAHLIQAGRLDNSETHLSDFLRSRALFWMEVMNLKKCMNTCPRIIFEVYRWLQVVGAPNDFCEMVHGSQKYVALVAASVAPDISPDIYIFLLASWKINGLVWSMNKRHQKKWVGLEQISLSKISLKTLATGKTLSPITSMSISFDGLRAVSGCHDGSIYIWDAYTARFMVEPFKAHTRMVKSVSFSPDGSRIVSGSYDSTIRIWDAYTGQAIAISFRGHTSMIGSVAFSPDGSCIVSGSNDRTVRLWDAYTGQAKAHPLKGHTGMVNCVAFSPNGDRIVSGSDDCTICIWNAHNGQVVTGPFKAHDSMVTCIGFSPNGTYIISGSMDCTVRLWNAHTGEAVGHSFKGHHSGVNSVGFSPDGACIVSGSRDRTVRLWNVHTSEMIGFFQEHKDIVVSVAFSPEGDRIISGSDDCTIRVWDVYTSSTAANSYERHTELVCSVAFSPEGSRVVSGSVDGTICVWNAHTGLALARPYKQHQSAVRSLAFSHDGSRVASGSEDSSILIWDTRTGYTVVDRLNGHTDTIASVAFSPNDSHIVSGSQDLTVRLWDVGTGSARSSLFKGHTGLVSSVAFSPCGGYIASGSNVGTVFVWNTHTGHTEAGPIKTLATQLGIIALFPSSNRLILDSSDNIIRIWHIQDMASMTSGSGCQLTHRDAWIASYRSQVLLRLFPGLTAGSDQGPGEVISKQYLISKRTSEGTADKYWEQYFTKMDYTQGESDEDVNHPQGEADEDQ